MKEDKKHELTVNEDLKKKLEELELRLAETTASRDFYYSEYSKTKQQFESFKNIVKSLIVIAN